MKRIVVLISVLSLSACGESSDDAYNRGYRSGYYDGTSEICYNIELKFPALLRELGC